MSDKTSALLARLSTLALAMGVTAAPAMAGVAAEDGLRAQNLTHVDEMATEIVVRGTHGSLKQWSEWTLAWGNGTKGTKVD